MKILAVLSTKGNYYLKYFNWMSMKYNTLYPEDKLEVITLDEFPGYDKPYDVLIYNTYPDESRKYKFRKELTYRCDEKFKQFTGLKMLLDNHDNGDKDGFQRLNDHTTPRIKANPDYRIMKEMNVVLSVPFVTYPIYCNPQEERTVELVCSMRTENMPTVRKLIQDKVRKFNPKTDKLLPALHAGRLCRPLINVVTSGTGSSS